MIPETPAATAAPNQNPRPRPGVLLLGDRFCRVPTVFPENEAFQRRAAIFIPKSAGAWKRMGASHAVYTTGERKMDAILDTLAASRKLKESGMLAP